MYNAHFSNLIEIDSVYCKWAYGSLDSDKTKFTDGTTWYAADRVLMNDILGNIQETELQFSTNLTIFRKNSLENNINLNLSSVTLVFMDMVQFTNIFVILPNGKLSHVTCSISTNTLVFPA
jgi:hypothetical protein